MRVLVVEDDASIVSALSDLLAAEGYDVTSAARQDDAIALQVIIKLFLLTILPVI